MSQTTAELLESKIRNHRLFEFPVDWSDELLFPYYDGLSLINITHSICQALGVPMPDSTPLLDEVWQADVPTARRVVSFLLDGTGYKHLRMLMEDDAELREAVLEINAGRELVPLTSVAPSTTAVALTSIWTGAPPAQTGMTGTVMNIREVATVADMLSYRPLFGKHVSDVLADWKMPPEKIVTQSGLGQHFKTHGVQSYVITPKFYVGSGLSRILNRGIDKIVTHLSLADFVPQVEKVLDETQGQHSYISIYWSGVDSLAHNYGAHHPYVNAEIKEKILALRDLMRQPSFKDGDTLLLFFADHGHYDSTQAVQLSEMPTIANAMQTALTGDERHAYLYVRHGTVNTVIDYIQDNLSDRLTVIESHKAAEAGYFGDNVTPQTMQRIGDLLLVPNLGHIVADPILGSLPMVSRHAGLADWEMLIPFIWQKL